MKIHGTSQALLVLCVLGGLIAFMFTPAIAATLTVPTPPGTNPATGDNGAQPRPIFSATGTVPATKAASTPVPQPTAPANGIVTLAQDNFQRPDQAFWGTSSGLRLWGGDANTNPTFAIVNHAGQISGSQGQSSLQAIMNVASPDAEIIITGSVSQFDARGSSNLGVVLRWQDANNWYKALIDGNNVQLLKNVNGKIAVLASQAFKATNDTSYDLRFRILGSNLFARAWADGQPEPATWTLMKADTQLANGVGGIRIKVVSGVQIRVTAFKETSVPNIM